jgi:aspartyl-tRNA(Asn)/glutamyl-tRNA(Gln) amidotransferase subunit C
VAVSREEVLHVARLARLQLTEHEIERFTQQLNGILAHVEELTTVPIENVDAMGGATEGAAPSREDRAGADSIELEPEQIAVSWADGFFTVPRLPALDADAAESSDGS